MLTEPKLTNLRSNYGQPASKSNPLLDRLGEPHLDSFNYMLEDGLREAVKSIDPVTLIQSNGSKLSIWIMDAVMNKPAVPNSAVGVKNSHVYPTECRQRGSTYKGRLMVKIGWSINGINQQPIDKDLGEIPIMIKSKQCHLNGKSPAELIKLKEHEQEWGGYFVIKGHERLIRMLLMTRRNYPIAIKRPTWKQRGALFSDLGILLRSVRDDNTAANNTLHYVTDGTVKLMFSYRKVLYYIPLVLMLKCLINVTDVQIYSALISGNENNTSYKNCILSMLRAVNEEGLVTHAQCKAYLGKMFRVKMFELSADSTDVEFCDYIIKHCIIIHHDDPREKFNLLIYMTKKLYVFADNKCAVEGADAVMMQECLLGGHLYLQVLKEKLYMFLTTVRAAIIKRGRSVGASFVVNTQEMLNALKPSYTLENQMENFLSTGSIRSPTGLGLMQNTGLTIVAENINRMRYMSHFRAIHRGSFFQEMRTTEARQLLPDAWGFICPVHTPDGAPCGLLNHLSMNCLITKHPDPKQRDNVALVLTELGMIPLSNMRDSDWSDSYTVLLDGRVLGVVADKLITRLVDKFRILKIKEEVPPTTEIVHVPKMTGCSQYPGLFLFSGPARMMRPVMNLAVNKVELIGTFEQVYLTVAINDQDMIDGVTTHRELDNTAFLSNLAQLIPLPDFNQSPRNMYQCQMGKQTMGTPCHTWQQQSETKLYRLQTPATPLFRPVHYDNIGLDEFPMGTNAVVAVISYTGYDMEDAMIINKAAYERGFAHATIYHSEFIDLPDAKSYFMRDPEDKTLNNLQGNGLPSPGTIIQDGDAYYCIYDNQQSRFRVGRHHNKEVAYVDSVKMCGNFGGTARACITFRIPRNPSVGDKFASRAGQKGICSQKWPAEDLPFTDSGMIPDILFNPHGFPSRMTIAMIVEMLAGKSAAQHGLVHDATPFKFDEENTAAEYFGELLKKAGFHYYGTEQLYSGIFGEAMTVDIFFGIVHYQRLRHMVSDKWQVRSTGPMDSITGQPIKGRKRGGGIRFGEMERDSLISHGCSFLLQDRLFNCSDKSTALVCTTCGTLLGPEIEMTNTRYDDKISCKLCKENGCVEKINIPYIFRFLVTQLMSCNINIKMSFKHI